MEPETIEEPEPTEEPKIFQTVVFLCGCELSMEGFKVEQDTLGYVLCPEHKSRRYGYISPLKDQYKTVPFNPDRPTYIERRNWDRSSRENEIEFWRRLGITITI